MQCQIPTQRHRRLSTLICLLLCSVLSICCAKSRLVDPAPLATPRLGRIVGEISLSPGKTPAGDRLVLWWETESEQRRTRGPSFALLVKLLTRFQVIPLRGRVQIPFKLRGVPFEKVRVKAQISPAAVFWDALFGGFPRAWRGTTPLVEVQRGGSARTRLLLSPGTEPKRTVKRGERCSGPRFRLFIVDAPYVKGRAGNRTRRRLCAYLPRSYKTSATRRYPVVFLLPGLGSADLRYLAGRQHLGRFADTLRREAILVGVDSRTVTGSSYFVDSVLNGQWARFIREAVKRVDSALRTIPRATARGIIGQSTGGFNAISLALRFPNLFATVGASAPDGLDLEGWLTERRQGQLYLRAAWLGWMRFEDALARPGYRQPGQMLSYAWNWSPAGDGTQLRWPADLRTGRIRPAIWRRWLANSPLAMLGSATILSSTRKSLNGRIFIAVGRRDEFGLFQPAKRFSQRLRTVGVTHRFQAGNGTHGNSWPRLTAALRFVAERLGPL